MKRKPRANPLANINPAEIRQEIEAAMPVVKDRAVQAGELLQNGIRKILPIKSDSPEVRYFKLLGLSFVGLILVGLMVGLATFLLTLRNPEAVVVPRVTGMELAEAIDALQEFGLVARLEQRYFPDPSSKGKVMEQNPIATTAVRVGRDVVIVLSKGAMVDKIANYSGRNVEEVREEIKSMFSGDKAMLSVGDLAFAFDSADAGTIISQDPVAGTTLDKTIVLSFLVSKGKDASLKSAPALLGLPWDKAIVELIAADIPFDCSLGQSGSEAEPGTVLSQEPLASLPVKIGERVKIMLAAPDKLEAAQVFGIYAGKLAEYAVPVEVKVSTVSPSGQIKQLWQFNHPGGILTFPYLIESGSDLVVSIFSKEMDRQVIKKD